MGWWKSEHGVIGDLPADIVDAALRKVELAYRKACGRPPTQGELADLVEFCTCMCLHPQCGDPAFPWSTKTMADKETPRAVSVNRQNGFTDDVPAGHLVNVDPKNGVHYHKSEAIEVLHQQDEEFRR